MIAYDTRVVEATLLRRYKRFLADVRLDDGSEVVAHCANPGRMTACWEPGARCRMTHHDNPRRKLKWSLEQVRMPDSWVMVNTARHNSVVEDGIERGAVPELAGYAVLERERPYPDGGRVDLRLSEPGTCWVEVKGVSLVEGDRLLFPDAVTKRGTRHLGQLADLAQGGERAVLFWCIGREDGVTVGPADHVDPDYGHALREAIAAGVEVLAYRCAMSAEGLDLTEPVPLAIG